MNKPMALLFALLSIACLIAAGAALSYMKPWWALFFTFLSFFITGVGMAVKRRLSQTRE